MNSKNSIIRDLNNIFALTGRFRTRLLVYFALQNVGNIMVGICVSFATKNIVDHFVDKMPNAITLTILSIITLLICGGVLLPVFYYLSTMIKARILNNIRQNLFTHLQSLPASYFDSHHSGDIFSRVNKDINALSSALDTIGNFSFHFMSIIMIIPYLASLDWRIGLIAFALGLLSMTFNLKFRLPIRNRSREVHKKSAVLNEQMTENVTGFNVIKTYGLGDIYFRKYKDSVNVVIKNELKMEWLSAVLYSTNSLIGWLSRGGIALLGCIFVLKGYFSIGTLMGSIFIASQLARAMVSIGEQLSMVQKSLAGSDRIYELLNVPAEPVSYETPGTGSNAGIGISDGTFAYETGPDIITGLNININKGQLAALVGYSGGGKSTIVKLIMGLYELKSGQMTVNGRAACEYDLNELRSMIAYVPQGAYVFNGTIRENIMYGNPDASEEDMIIAAKKANAHDFIMEQKNQYDTLVGERGIRLSGGQRQRVAIARAILKDAPILLLDEATSSLDSESENLIQNSLDELMKNRTSLVVAHRLSTVEHADVIFFIEDGQVVEQGTHRELLASHGKYCELYYREFVKSK